MDRHHEARDPGFGMMETVEQPQVDDDSGPFMEKKSLLDTPVQQETARWAGYSESNPSLQVLDILQESTTLLRKHNDILFILAIVLAIPLSIILLSHVLLRFPFMERLVRDVQLVAEQRVHYHSQRAGYRRLAEIIMSNVVDIPFSALFSPLLKAGVAHIVASTYGRRKPKLSDISETLQKIWVRLMQTFAWSCSVYLSFATAFVILLWYASSTGKSSSLVITLGLVGALLVGLALATGFAYTNVMCNLAYVVSALEGLHGREALLQSKSLLKGRVQVALLLFLVTNVNGTLLDILFEFHIIRNSDATIVYDKYWEAPLLVCMHSFVYLFDAIMISVLYYICKSSEPDSRAAHHVVAAGDQTGAIDSAHVAPL